MSQLQLKDGSFREFTPGQSAAEIVKGIGMGLYKAACCVKINGEVCDLRTPVTEDCTFEVCTFDDPDGKKTFWHTASHVLAQAVKRLYPNAKLAIGPAIDSGFYYDFDVEKPFTAEELRKIEAEMKKIVKENAELEQFTLSPDEAISFLKEQDEPYSIPSLPEASEACKFIPKPRPTTEYCNKYLDIFLLNLGCACPHNKANDRPRNKATGGVTHAE